MKIRSFAKGGVQIDFDNGKTISIMFSPGTYGSNYNTPFERVHAGVTDYPSEREAKTCEVAVFDTEGDQWYYPYNLNPVDEEDGHTHVEGYVSVEKVLAMIQDVKEMP